MNDEIAALEAEVQTLHDMNDHQLDTINSLRAELLRVHEESEDHIRKYRDLQVRYDNLLRTGIDLGDGF